MALDDYIEPDVGLAVATTALVFSPGARQMLHRGAVYGVAGVLVVGDALVALGRGLTRGLRAGVAVPADASAGVAPVEAPSVMAPATAAPTGAAPAVAHAASATAHAASDALGAVADALRPQASEASA